MADETRHSQALEPTNMQAFVRALYEAHDASDAVDRFDRREDEASRKKWETLLDRQREAFRVLHEVCCRTPVSELTE